MLPFSKSTTFSHDLYFYGPKKWCLWKYSKHIIVLMTCRQNNGFFVACVASIPVWNRAMRNCFFKNGVRAKRSKEGLSPHFLHSLSCSHPIFCAAWMRKSSFVQPDLVRLVRECLLCRLVSLQSFRHFTMNYYLRN